MITLGYRFMTFDTSQVFMFPVELKVSIIMVELTDSPLTCRMTPYTFRRIIYGELPIMYILMALFALGGHSSKLLYFFT